MKTHSLPETQLRRSVDNKMGPYWKMTWHEDREITPGVPDLHYVMTERDVDYRVGWLELKAINTQITASQRIHVQPSQLQYARRWHMVMPIHFLVRVQERIFVIDAKYADHITRATCRGDLAVIADIQFDEDQMEDFLPQFLRDLTRI